MDFTIERTADKTTKKKFRQAFFALQLPNYVITLTAFVFCIVLGTILSFPRSCLFFGLSAILLMKMLTWWPIHWRLYNKVLKKQHAFETPTRIHFSDSFLEISCGENYSKKEYSFFTHYFCQKKQIVLLFQKGIQGVFNKNKFEDDGEEWIRCLEAHGVKKLHFWSLRRWALPIVIVLIFIIAGALLWGTRTESKLDENGMVCLENLEEIREFFQWYEYDHNALPASMQELKNAYCAEGDFPGICPETKEAYKLVPYKTLPDGDEAAHLPVLLDGIQNHHVEYIDGSNSFSSPITYVQMANGNIDFLYDIDCYMDVFDKYAVFLSPQNAEILKECCRGWDDETKTLP